MMHPFTWRETNKMIWRTDVGLTQKVVNRSKVKIATLSWSGYKTHRGRPVNDGGMTVTLVEHLLNKRHDTLAALTHWQSYRPKFEKGMTQGINGFTQYPTQVRGRCRVQERLLPRLHSLLLFPFPQPYGWVLLSCFTSSREITDARCKLILRTSPPKYFLRTLGRSGSVPLWAFQCVFNESIERKLGELFSFKESEKDRKVNSRHFGYSLPVPAKAKRYPSRRFLQ